MRAIHFLINALQWVLTFVGILAALVWVAELTGQLKTFNVLTGSMTPHIRTGDLVVDRPVQVDQLKAGEVATLRFGLNGDLVTHRIVKIVYRKGVYTITMKGDANPVPDAEPYVIRSGTKVWHPVGTIRGGGRVLTRLTSTAVGIPLLVAFLAITALNMIPKRTPEEPDPDEAEVDDEAASEDEVAPDDQAFTEGDAEAVPVEPATVEVAALEEPVTVSLSVVEEPGVEAPAITATMPVVEPVAVPIPPAAPTADPAAATTVTRRPSEGVIARAAGISLALAVVGFLLRRRARRRN